MKPAFIFSAILFSFSIGLVEAEPADRFQYLVGELNKSSLKTKLSECLSLPVRSTDFSISHRGAPRGYPEHSREGYLAAIEMGAGLVECDAVLTKDRELVCRHSECDLHRTTNVLKTELASQCNAPFEPWKPGSRATARCCTSDLTLRQFKSLCARSDRVNDRATSVEEYLVDKTPMKGTPNVRCGTLQTHRESIRLISEHGRKHIPELKVMNAQTLRVLNLSVEQYADMLLSEYRSLDISPDRVFLQSFSWNVIEYWLGHYPQYAKNVVFLDGRGRNPSFRSSQPNMESLYEKGLRIIAPPIPMLLEMNEQGALQETRYASHALAAGLDLITWTFESGLSDIPGFSKTESDRVWVLHALRDEAKVRGVFSDWPNTVTRYANCMNL